MTKLKLLKERRQSNGGALRFSYGMWKGTPGLCIQSFYKKGNELKHSRRGLFVFEHEIKALKEALAKYDDIRGGDND